MFAVEFDKSISMFVINILKFVENEFLTNSLNFGIGMSFLKSGSGFA